jgi:hypothetical protein
MQNMYLIRTSLRGRDLQKKCRDCKILFYPYYVPAIGQKDDVLVRQHCQSCLRKPQEEFVDKYSPGEMRGEKRNWVYL